MTTHNEEQRAESQWDRDERDILCMIAKFREFAPQIRIHRPCIRRFEGIVVDVLTERWTR